MSTKIHNGWRYCPGGPPDVFTLSAELTVRVTPALRTVYRARIAQVATDLVDAQTFPVFAAQLEDDDRGATTSSQYLLLNAERQVGAAHISSLGSLRRSRDLFSADATILADPTDPTSLLVLDFTGEHDLSAAFAQVPGLVRYQYWNNTDRPAELTEHDWDVRAHVWDTALGWDTPAERGVTWSAADVTFSTFGDPEGVTEVLSLVPTDMARARRVVFAEHVERIKLAPRQGRSATSQAVSATSDARDAADADTTRLGEVTAELVPVTRDLLLANAATACDPNVDTRCS